MPTSPAALALEAVEGAARSGLLYTPTSRSLERALARLRAAGVVVRPHRGLYAPSATWEALNVRERYMMWLRSLSRRHPDWVFCSHSAAAAYGVELPHRAMGAIHIVASRTTRDGDICRHHIKAAAADERDGIKVTAFAHAVGSSIVQLDFPYALGVADSALRVADCTGAHLLRSMFDQMKGTCRREYLADVLSYADSRSENGGESYARAIMIEQGVMLPELQVEHIDPISGKRYRVDYEWELANGVVCGELDGAEKYSRIARRRGRSIEDVLREERQRESRLRNQGMRFARFTFDQVREVDPFLAILDSCGIPRIGSNPRAPRRV